MREPRPRKVPRQARSRETFDAIVEACARLLRAGDYAAVTTNHIAERAGVSIGTLYEFFPNKESIIATLTERRLSALLAELSEGVEVALGLDEREGAEFLIRRIVEAVSAERELYQVLFRQAPFVQQLSTTRRAMAAFFELGRMGAERARARVNLPSLEADTWLISRMVYNAVLEIAFFEEEGIDRKVLTDELVRLTFRMLQGRDPVTREARASNRTGLKSGTRALMIRRRSR
ncbi:MAG: TetR/AcrR family transcriptional regulator [Candidatus Binatia bacterium]